jgi:uncharacterized membrane protein
MRSNQPSRRFKPIAGALAIAAALASLAVASPASATDLYASGAAVQNSIQQLWIKDDSAKPSITYTSTNSADGFGEFGNFDGVLDLADDPTADAAGDLDAYVAVDNAPTGPESTTGTNLNFAGLAAYGNPPPAGDGEVTIPVGQTPLALLVSLPTGVLVASGATLSLPNQLAALAYAGKTDISTGNLYPKDTWGALLLSAGYTALAAGRTPSGQEFVEDGSESAKTGGFSLLQDEVRANGAGATLTLKQYYNDIDPTDWTTVDENTSGSGEWPTTPLGSNSGDSSEAQLTALNPGTLGYSTLASATTSADGGFTNGALPGKESGAGSNDVLYALLQDNGTNPSGAKYADPEAGTGTQANVYTGTKVNANGSGGVGNWLVPSSPTGDWATSTTNPADYTHAWDLDVFDDSGKKATNYPLIVTLWDLGWSNYDAGSLTTKLFPTALVAELGSFANYVTSGGSSPSTSGQFLEENDSSYYAELPTGGTGLANIQLDANKAALDLPLP